MGAFSRDLADGTGVRHKLYSCFFSACSDAMQFLACGDAHMAEHFNVFAALLDKKNTCLIIP